jgi:hypothetical protein
MFRAIRTRITPATILATVALVFAMTGGAYAAKKYLITSTKQISPKVLSSLKGAKGAAGTAGAAGPAGPQGPSGTAGTTGKEGPTGKEGTPGKEGSAGKEGTKGLEGAKGVEGSPWTAGGTLPSGKTETGAWSFGKESQSAQAVEVGIGTLVAVSFPIPLAQALSGAHVHYVNTATGEEVEAFEENLETQFREVPQTACPGVGKANQGELCVYQSGRIGDLHIATQLLGDPTESQPPLGFEWGAGKTGVLMNAVPTGELSSSAVGWGTWAVTAP